MHVAEKVVITAEDVETGQVIFTSNEMPVDDEGAVHNELADLESRLDEERDRLNSVTRGI